ncbi:MAG TPA: 2-hydroxyacyl-CoA dehydratase family protein [Thermoanaerobaculia bacterium]|nr:2-hydroxyacyl-CoA dehydratase family protein [Thermoanaerobaculia bacterium]
MKSEYRGSIHQRQKELMTRWYERLENAGDGVAMMISGNCIELLQAFDLPPFYPEINALQLAIRHQSLEPILAAEEMGYAADNCAYVKADVGAWLKGITPTGRPLAHPALVLCNFVGCNTYVKWFEHTAALTGAPLYVLDVPFLRDGEPTADAVTYVVRQLREVIARLEKISGQRFDIDRLREAVANAAAVEDAWSKIKHLCRNTPAPFDAYFDAITLMGPLYVYRASREGVEFFNAALDEIQQKVDRNEGVYDAERFRIVVEGPPPYSHFRNFRDMFAKWKAVAVASTYSTVGGLWEFGFRHDPDEPLESIARHMLEYNVTNRNYLQRYDQIERYLREWNADGIVIHFVKSCRLFSAGQGDMRDYFTRQHDVPTLYIESDLEDPRYFSEAQIKNRVDAFFEALEHRKTVVGSQLSVVPAHRSDNRQLTTDNAPKAPSDNAPKVPSDNAPKVLK